MNSSLNVEKAFKTIGESKSLNLLPSKILMRIDGEQMKRSRIQMAVSWLVGGFSFVALFPILINMSSQLQSSGFWNYFSLLFTDTGAMAIFWKEFLLSLVDALPLFQLTLVFILILTLFISLRFALKDFKRIGLSANLA
jgi:hypothetical protein